MNASVEVTFLTIDEAVLDQLVGAAIDGAAPDEVTPSVTPAEAWTAERVSWLREFHRDRLPGLDGGAAEATWAVVAAGAVVGSVRLRRLGQPGVLEAGIWLTREARGRGIGRNAMALLIEEAQALGAVRVQATTTAGNAAALSALRGLGASVTFGPGDEVAADLVLSDSSAD